MARSRRYKATMKQRERERNNPTLVLTNFMIWIVRNCLGYSYPNIEDEDDVRLSPYSTRWYGLHQYPLWVTFQWKPQISKLAARDYAQHYVDVMAARINKDMKEISIPPNHIFSFERFDKEEPFEKCFFKFDIMKPKNFVIRNLNNPAPLLPVLNEKGECSHSTFAVMYSQRDIPFPDERIINRPDA